jgi:hypothetical protein
MKIVHVDNLQLQFDSMDDEEVTKEYVDSMVELINHAISQNYPDSQPKILKQENTKITIVEIS